MNFPGGSVVKTFLPSNAGDRCNQGAKIPYASGQNLNIKQKQYCNKSIQTLKMAHIKNQFSSVSQSCPTLRDPMDCSLPGSSIHGICQARVLEWGAVAFSEKQISFPQ